MRRKPKSKLDGRLRRITRSPDFSAWRRATTRPTSSSASAFWRVCAKPEFRKNDLSRGLPRRTGHRGASSAARPLVPEGASTPHLLDGATWAKASVWGGGDSHFV